MHEDTEVTLRLIEQFYLQVRQSEDQRAAITGVIVLIASAIQGALTQTGFQKNALTLTVTLIILGLFGMLASEKLNERRVYYQRRIAYLFQKLEELVPKVELQKLKEKADREHVMKYYKIFTILSRNIIWQSLFLLITFLGIVFTLIILI